MGRGGELAVEAWNWAQSPLNQGQMRQSPHIIPGSRPIVPRSARNTGCAWQSFKCASRKCRVYGVASLAAGGRRLRRGVRCGKDCAMPADRERRPPSEYRAKLPANRVIGDAMCWLLPAPIAKRDALDLFERRASYPAINAWRHGTRRPPQWAVEILERKIREHMAPGADLCERIYSAIGPGQAAAGAAGARALRAWRLKQKAGS